jgi:hypothetical protein
MTALEVIDLVESAGGQVSLRGGKVNCRLPEGTDEALIKLLREQRDDIARGLRLREEYIGKARRLVPAFRRGTGQSVRHVPPTMW